MKFPQFLLPICVIALCSCSAWAHEYRYDTPLKRAYNLKARKAWPTHYVPMTNSEYPNTLKDVNSKPRREFFHKCIGDA